MKKFKTGLVALALILGVSGALVTKIHAAPKVKLDTYDWTSTSVAPENPSSTFDGKTIVEAQDRFGCSGNGDECAHGVNNGAGPDADILLNQ